MKKVSLFLLGVFIIYSTYYSDRLNFKKGIIHESNIAVPTGVRASLC